MVEPTKRRIQAHRERDLKPGEKQLFDDVENYGCHVIHVREDQHLPGWSYTIGLYETFRQPEILAVGLKIDTALTCSTKLRNALTAVFISRKVFARTNSLQTCSVNSEKWKSGRN
jgi:hypothetical protein